LVKQGYSFKTSSDTEVLMALYDKERESCLQFLDGMFAFALYDQQEKTLFCARDRFGEKPFHYHYVPGSSFVFGSEMKELWAAGISRTTNNRMLYNYLRYGFVHNPDDNAETFYKDVFRLEQAHYMLIDTQKLSVKKVKYWGLDLSKSSVLSLDDAAQQFRELFLTSIKRRLRSDVPVGSSLSGGLDSSAVVCAIDSLNAGKRIHQKTFSAQFPGYQKDESYFQKLVINQTQADAFYTYPGADVMLAELDNVFWHQEEPFGSASIMAQYEVFKLARENKVVVLLDGQGADEFLAGYHGYLMYYFLELEKNKKELNHQLDTYSKLHSGNQVNGLYRKDLKYELRRKLSFAFNAMRKVQRIVNETRGSFNKDFYQEHKHESFLHQSNFHTLNEALCSGITGGALQDLLRYADRNSMAHSLEVRLPFLNHDLVEFVFGLPATYKINEGWTKYIMRNALKDLMPAEITWRIDKIGYEPPQQKWMEREDVKEEVRGRKQQLVQAGILDAKEGNKDVVAVAAGPGGLNDWNCWMAGKLVG
jgi:asparagine synthase (glutamine-hydrolysing)